MRLNSLALAVLVSVLAATAPPRAAAQNPETMLPEASAAKARELLRQMIAALGGRAYLGVRESLCDGRLAQFDHNGELTGYATFKDFWRFPDKNRTEYSKKGNIIELFAGDSGWSLDRGGVTEQPATAVTDFKEQVQRDMDNLLRFRLQEEGLVFRYGGGDIVDLTEVDWAEIVDLERRTFRIAINRSTHLPMRSLVITRNDLTRERTEEMTTYSNYHVIDGVQSPKQIARERDGRRLFQAFFFECRYNSGIPDELFTRASLEKRYAETAKKKKNKRESESKSAEKEGEKEKP